MAQGIKCLVEECVYNEHQACQANAIEVKSTGDKRVMTSDGSCCDTFKPKKYDDQDPSYQGTAYKDL